MPELPKMPDTSAASPLPDYEKLGAFYLGRLWDPTSRQAAPAPLLYDSRDLTTHAVCVGMTGSGKTGLCLGILEEAAIDGVPVIAIDPKGDLGNLLLQFPELRPADFRPWIDPGEAERAGLSPDDYAAKTAERWRAGLSEWGQDGARVARLAAAADFAVYTPGGSAGLPLSLLRSLAAPSPAVLADADAVRERIAAAVSGLLALLGIAADPLRSREHILLSNILDRAWRAGRDLELAALIREIQAPPFERVGVMDLETFYPARDRAELALTLNNLLASPGFAAWLEGEPLDIARLLRAPDGRPRVSILNIAHLSDAERMFFVTLLLTEVVAWMRGQSGTSSLRALLYMDEIYGFFPPSAMPPAKGPMLTLLKQARAFGLGVVLATQNPVDLDYKGLANAGTWFIGRLQTERDQERVLDGLAGATVAAPDGKPFDRAAMAATLSGLGPRVFLLHNVHEDAPALFQTRWLLSYLRGPLARAEVAALTASRRGGTAVPEAMGGTVATPPSRPIAGQPAATGTGAPAVAPAAGGQGGTQVSSPAAPLMPAASGPAAEVLSGVAADSSAAPTATPASALGAGGAPGGAPGGALGSAPGARPLLPPEANEAFLSAPAGERPVVYRPAVLGVAKLHYVSAEAKVDSWETVALLAPLAEDAAAPNWDEATVLPGEPPGLSREPAGAAGAAAGGPAASGPSFAPVPPAAQRAKSYAAWQKTLVDHLYQTRALEIAVCPALKAMAQPGESAADFQARLALLQREARDAAADKLRAKYAPKLAALQERLRRAQERVEREKAQAQQQQAQAAISVGATLLGAFLGRKVASAGTIGRATTAVRGASRAAKEKGDIALAQESVAAVQQRLADLEAEFQAEAAALAGAAAVGGAAGGTVGGTPAAPGAGLAGLPPVETIAVRPRKTDVAVTAFAFVWEPTGG